MVYPDDKKVWLFYLESYDCTSCIEEIYGLHFTESGAQAEKDKYISDNRDDSETIDRLKIMPIICEDP